MKKLRILVLNGPNLNLLGTREPSHYGAKSLGEITQSLVELGDRLDVEITTHQSNHEGELVEQIHKAAAAGINGIVFNPAAYTHTSIALRDAILGTRIPFIEVHLSNIHRRESFRHRSLLADLAVAVIAGFGPASYTLALQGLAEHLRNTQGE